MNYTKIKINGKDYGAKFGTKFLRNVCDGEGHFETIEEKEVWVKLPFGELYNRISAETFLFLPDLILLDLRMPDMSGDEMLAKMRATEWGKSMKVIILTNISKDEAPRTLSHLGISHYIMKVLFTPQQVVELVQKTLAEAA